MLDMFLFSYKRYYNLSIEITLSCLSCLFFNWHSAIEIGTGSGDDKKTIHLEMYHVKTFQAFYTAWCKSPIQLELFKTYFEQS